MGAWNVGMQANDAAEDAIDHSKITRPQWIRTPGGVANIFDEIWDDEFGEEMNLATLGVAEHLLDRGVDLSPFRDRIREFIRLEAHPDRLNDWGDDGANRLEALLLFERRLCGESVDLAKVDAFNEVDTSDVFSLAIGA